MPSKAAPRRRPNQERAKLTRDHILDTAARLFGERGIANTSTNRIAVEAGVSIGTVYRYFADRTVIVEELLARLLADAEKHLHRALETPGSSAQQRFAVALEAISAELTAEAALVRALVGGVHFYDTAIPDFEPRLHRLIKANMVQLLGPGDDREYDMMTFVVLNTAFAGVLRAATMDVDEHERREAVAMTARLAGAWIDARVAQRDAPAAGAAPAPG
ncbi:TetR/AcrR family transcriptional regulator [Nocardia farcinica]|uniref:TetR/AcrR family transcriptional regulator n=1 Tax=Nocardia farcinica TaxID=37329 RepID=UPI002457A526|nr:TetR family transcriptional regulator [Nocardia farcinica]